MEKHVTRLQIIAAYSGLYGGPIDGLLTSIPPSVFVQAGGPVNLLGQRHVAAAIQALLNRNEIFDRPVTVDGYWGNETEARWLEFSAILFGGGKLQLFQPEIKAPVKQGLFPTIMQREAFYGKPETIEAQLVYVTSPYELVLGYNPREKLTRFRMHPLCATNTAIALKQILAHYGEKQIVALKLNVFDGSYNFRRMRGGNNWSSHAFGCAIDWYAAKNGLTTRAPDAVFSGDQYKPFFDIWASNGFRSLGRVIGRDWMHVEAVS